MCCSVGQVVDDAVGELIDKGDFCNARAYVHALGEDITFSNRRKLLERIHRAENADSAAKAVGDDSAARAVYMHGVPFGGLEAELVRSTEQV